MPEPTTNGRIRYLLVCCGCEHAWEPDLTEPGELSGTGCPRCGGWTWLGEITQPDPVPTEARMSTERAS